MSNTSRKLRVPLLARFITLLITGLAGIYLVAVLIRKSRKGEAAVNSVIKKSEWVNLYPLILAQSKLETANYTSRVYRDLNNLFGMNVPSKRPFLGERGTRTPEGGTYAKYPDDVTSVKDYVEWLRYTKFPTNSMNSETFVNEMQRRGYFTTSKENYLKALKSWL